MGSRMNRTFYSECCCPNCGQNVSFEQNASEYPEGSIEHVYYPKCSGGEILVAPKVEISYFNDELYVSDVPSYSRRLSSKPTVLNLDYKLSIDVVDGDAHIENKLNLQDKRTTIWLNPIERLLPILIEETGTIRFDENKAVFAEVLQTNPKIGAMRLLGKVAEAIMVKLY